ncbi:unnamed protein product [Protopolystoma xenopodis]|uniref:Uncharacterized protein n=1 Tax=Protopolystoma xenopodis TaxID=117903 RepID=A0A3S5B9D8_9PLAT|nr:unnamed protein product [Protopolystoma xenopodis]
MPTTMLAKRLGMYHVYGSNLELIMQTMDSALDINEQLLPRRLDRLLATGYVTTPLRSSCPTYSSLPFPMLVDVLPSLACVAASSFAKYGHPPFHLWSQMIKAQDYRLTCLVAAMSDLITAEILFYRKHKALRTKICTQEVPKMFFNSWKLITDRPSLVNITESLESLFILSTDPLFSASEIRSSQYDSSGFAIRLDKLHSFCINLVSSLFVFGRYPYSELNNPDSHFTSGRLVSEPNTALLFSRHLIRHLAALLVVTLPPPPYSTADKPAPTKIPLIRPLIIRILHTALAQAHDRLSTHLILATSSSSTQGPEVWSVQLARFLGHFSRLLYAASCQPIVFPEPGDSVKIGGAIDLAGSFSPSISSSHDQFISALASFSMTPADLLVLLRAILPSCLLGDPGLTFHLQPNRDSLPLDSQIYPLSPRLLNNSIADFLIIGLVVDLMRAAFALFVDTSLECTVSGKNDRASIVEFLLNFLAHPNKNVSLFHRVILCFLGLLKCLNL